MQIDFTFRNMESSEALKSCATDKLAKLDKYLRPPAEAHVTFALERRLQCVDVTVSASGERFQGRAENEDMYASIDIVVDKLLRQLHRVHGQTHNHRRGPQVDDSPGE